jgi:hypothetical protein
LDAEELQRYVNADPDQRDELVYDWLRERVEDIELFEELISGHDVVYQDEDATRDAWSEASQLGITADQYVWLGERLTDQEFDRLSDDDMHELLAREYVPYSAPD